MCCLCFSFAWALNNGNSKECEECFCACNNGRCNGLSDSGVCLYTCYFLVFAYFGKWPVENKAGFDA